MTSRNVIPILVVIVVLASLGAFVTWRLKGEHAARPAFHVAILHDRSESVRAGCESVVGLAQQALAEHGSGDITLTVLTTGDAASANEPVEIGHYSLSPSHRALEGRGTLVRKREELLQGLTARCTRVAPTQVSPIYLGLRRALEQLHAIGCEAPNECRLLAATDSKETVEPAIVAALRGEVAKDPASLLQNRDIPVLLCGLAETTAREDEPPSKKNMKKPAPVVDMTAVWRSVFSEPEFVRFEPYCFKGRVEEGAR